MERMRKGVAVDQSMNKYKTPGGELGIREELKDSHSLKCRVMGERYKMKQKVEITQMSITDEWINKMWHIHTMEYYLGIKRNEGLIHAITWMNLENRLTERSHTPYILRDSIYEMSRRRKTIDREQINGYQEVVGKQGMTANGVQGFVSGL